MTVVSSAMFVAMAFAACDSSSDRVDPTATPWVVSARTPAPTATSLAKGRLLDAPGFTQAMNDEVVFLLAEGYRPGTVLQAIDSIRYMETSAGEAADILDDFMLRDRLDDLDADPDRRVWLFAAGGQLSSTSIHGGLRGQGGTVWILVMPDGEVRSGDVRNGLKVGPPYVGEEIGRSLNLSVDAKRVAPGALVRDTHGAVQAVANLLVEVQASVSAIAYTYTSASQAEALTGVSLEGNGAKTGAWIFNLTGNFQLICGGNFHVARSSLRLLVYEGRSSPYILRELDRYASSTPTPTPASGLFETYVIEPGEYPELDRFRRTDHEIAATATAFASAAVVDCPPP